MTDSTKLRRIYKIIDNMLSGDYLYPFHGLMYELQHLFIVFPKNLFNTQQLKHEVTKILRFWRDSSRWAEEDSLDKIREFINAVNEIIEQEEDKLEIRVLPDIHPHDDCIHILKLYLTRATSEELDDQIDDQIDEKTDD